jgi:hypothetical protein
MDRPSSSVTRFLDASLFLLLVTGFVTMASTGKVDALALLIVSAALLCRAYLLVRGRDFVLSERATSVATVAYVFFYLMDYFFVSGAFVPATVHLVLFSMVIKVFSVRRDRDRLYLAILAFLAVLAAAALTVDSVFLASFCVFLLLAIASFVAFEMKRSAERAVEARAPYEPRALAMSLCGTALAVMLAVVAAGTVIFFVLPRLSAGYLSAYAPRNDLVTGFSDSVRLGQIGDIKQSNTVVMHVQIEGDTRGAFDLKWRGVALGIFSGNAWSNPMGGYESSGAADGGFELASLAALRREGGRLHVIRYRVLLESIGSNVFFLAPGPQVLYGNYNPVAVDGAGSVFNNDREHMITSYRAVSYVQQAEPLAVRAATGELAPGFATYLRLPGLDRRIGALAEQVTRSAPTPYDKAAALEKYLREGFGYTLQQPRPAPQDPLAYFLFERKQGHCEYFASAMAVMLRTLGIPSRVVNGFRGGEFNQLTGSYIIRARDAHTWVEAYFPGYGWATFDPTPPDPRLEFGAWSRSMMYLDALREFWREWVVNYDFAHQTNLAISATARSRRTAERARQWWREQYAWMVDRARRVHAATAASPQRTGSVAVCFAALMLVLGNLGRLRREWHHHRLKLRPERAPDAAAAMWYGCMIRILARQGYRKKPAQTPAEFVTTIEIDSLRRSVAAFTAHYERARFGDSAADARRLPELLKNIQSPSS